MAALHFFQAYGAFRFYIFQQSVGRSEISVSLFQCCGMNDGQ